MSYIVEMKSTNELCIWERYQNIIRKADESCDFGIALQEEAKLLNMSADEVLVDLFRSVVQDQKNIISESLSKKIFFEMNKRFIDPQFKKQKACVVANIVHTCFKKIIPRLESLEVSFVFTKSNSLERQEVKLNVLPLIHVSEYFRVLLITGNFKEACSKEVTLVDIRCDVFLKLYDFFCGAERCEHMVYSDFFDILNYLNQWLIPEHIQQQIFSPFMALINKLDSNELFSAMRLLSHGKIPRLLMKIKTRTYQIVEQMKDVSAAVVCDCISQVQLCGDLVLRRKCARQILLNISLFCKKAKSAGILETQFYDSLVLMKGWLGRIPLHAFHEKMSQEHIEYGMLLFSNAITYANLTGVGKNLKAVIRLLPTDVEEISMQDGCHVDNEILEIIVRQCPRVKKISISGSQITRLDCLQKCEQLHTLLLPYAKKIKSFESMPFLPNLQMLDISHSKIEKIPNLKEKLPLLQTLVAKGMKEGDVEESLIMQLKMLHISI